MMNERGTGVLGLDGTGSRVHDVAEELHFGYLNRAIRLHEQNYCPADLIDTAMRLGCNMPAGPLELIDRIGPGPISDRMAILRSRTGREVFDPTATIDRLVADGQRLRDDSRGHSDPGIDGGDERVATVGVVGTGTMARGIAETLVLAGLQAVVVGRTRHKADLVIEAIARSLDKAVQRGKLSPDNQMKAVARLTAVDTVAGLADCDLIVEAVVEAPAAKREVFTELDIVAKPAAVLATTTSSLSIADCAAATVRPASVVGLHFFNPARHMKLVEIVYTDKTSTSVVDAMRGFCARLGKTGVVCADRTGFIVNYLLAPYLNDAVRMTERYDVRFDELDTTMVELYGYPVGPFRLIDIVGVDVLLATQQRLAARFPEPDLAPTRMLEQMVRAGHLGAKTGRGFYPGDE